MIAGMREALAIARGEVVPAKVRRLTARSATVMPPPRYARAAVRRVRAALGLAQPIFAQALNVSVATVRAWEQGVRRPDGPTRRLLHLAERHPDVVLEAIRSKDGRVASAGRRAPRPNKHR